MSSGSTPLTLFLVAAPGYALALPTSVLAWQQSKARRMAEDNKKLNERIDERLSHVQQQVQPSNGKTMARLVEDLHDTNREMGRVSVLMGEHMSDGHGGQVWPAGRLT